MIEVNIKPLSVNSAWKGKRYKTDLYKKYSKILLLTLPPLKLPPPPYILIIHYYFSNPLSDVDNPCKPLQDILATKYGFNDKEIKLLIQEKPTIVEKGFEKIQIKILEYSKEFTYFASLI